MKYELMVMVAKFLFFIGLKPKYSTGICGKLTAGYGRLNSNGYWQFQLPCSHKICKKKGN